MKMLLHFIRRHANGSRQLGISLIPCCRITYANQGLKSDTKNQQLTSDIDAKALTPLL